MKRPLRLIFPALIILPFLLPGSSAARPDIPVTKLRVNGRRLALQIESLSEIGKNRGGGVDRLAFSEADIKAREYILTYIRKLGLRVQVDAAGNIIGRKEGTDPGLPPILVGSHIDTVPDGGKYDGALGILAAIECVQVMGERKVTTRYPLEIVVFSDEEGGSIGSLAMAGELPAAAMETISQSGKTIGEGIRSIGGDPAKVALAARPRGEIKAYLELHIEQGGRLDSQKTEIGVVEGIVGIKHWEVRIEGVPNHAGTTPMNSRHDALLAASHLIIAINQVVTGVPGNQVGTVGRIMAEPGAPNVIPGLVVLSLELRDLAEEKIQFLYLRIRDEARAIEQKTGTKMTFIPIEPASKPAPTDPRLRVCIARAAENLGLSKLFLPSGAGHDAQNIARLAPIGMIFIPSVGGISHSPKEYSRPEDVERGANVLLQTILGLDQGCLEENQ